MTNESRFRLIERLGGGAFGAVHLAFDNELDIRVAIKIPHDKEKERALRNEAKIMARLRPIKDDHIVTMYEFGEINGTRVIVMEYVDGGSLRKRIGRLGEQKPLEVGAALDVAMQASIGLRSLHQAFAADRGLFHRDIKPENILVSAADQRVKLTDFGIAKILEASNLASTTAGTVPYMAPELLQGDGGDFRADIYGLGVTLYEMLTGRLPFDPEHSPGRAKAQMTYLNEICAGHPPRPADIANISDELSGTVLKAMHRDVESRFQSAQEFYNALSSHYEGFSVDRGIERAMSMEGEARVRALEEVLRAFPSSSKTYRKLAVQYKTQLRRMDAIGVLEDGRNRCPRSAEILMELAMLYREIGQRERAVRTLSEARRLQVGAEMLKQIDLLLRSWRRAS